MSLHRLPLYDRDGFSKIDPFCIYSAFAPIDERMAYVKIGVSQSPLQRIYDVNCGSPIEVETALWSYVGSKQRACGVEKSILTRLAEFSTRGEWLRLDLSNAVHKERFHTACKDAFKKATGHELKWKKVTLEQVKSMLEIDGLAIAKKIY